MLPFYCLLLLGAYYSSSCPSLLVLSDSTSIIMSGWSQHPTVELHALVDEEYRLWIRWPIEELGALLDCDIMFLV